MHLLSPSLLATLAWPGLALAEQSRADLTLDSLILSVRFDSWAGPKLHGWLCPHLLLSPAFLSLTNDGCWLVPTLALS